jgi:DNA-binding NarL/FixJ family response regulator
MGAEFNGNRSRRAERADPVAVERAVSGDRPARLHPAELHLAIAELVRQGCSYSEAARRLGVAKRTVERHRRVDRDLRDA